jgi:hypothetical protein
MHRFYFFQHHDPTQTLRKTRTPWPWLQAELVLTQNGDGDLSAPWQAPTSGPSVGSRMSSLSLSARTGKTMSKMIRNPRSGRAEEMGSEAYDYEEVRSTSKAPWRTSSCAGCCCSSSSLGRRPRLVHRGSEGPGGGAPRSQIVREAALQDVGANLQPLWTARASTG